MHRGLAALSIDARAALVASVVERFDPIDVETILDAAPAATRHAVAEARSRYMRFAATGSGEEPGAVPDEPRGEIAARVQEVSARAFSSVEDPR